MREPQVDTFCRCVKKVKKTLKAEGRAIAICTKSVLQTKGRTLRKVRCRDHLLETQPMKSGRRTRAERNATIERNETHVVYVKDDTVKTPAGSERIMGLPVGQASVLAAICKKQGKETIDAKYLTKVPHSAALILFFGKKPQADILRAKHPLGNLPIEKAKGFAIVNFSGDDLELDALCADESTRGMGVGTNTLKYIETMATLNGKKRVLLDALPDAVPFYVKQGYKNTRDNFYAKELVPQEGGVFKWAGADTPVFDDEKVGDWNGFPIMDVNARKPPGWLEEQIKIFNPAVVRMVSSGDGEIPMHRALKDIFNEKVYPPPFDEFVKMHINLWAGGGIYRVDYNKTLAMVDKQKDRADKTKKLKAINDRFVKDAPQDTRNDWYGLVTRRQASDVRDLKLDKKISALCTILRVLLHIDGRIIHFDLHSRNMAVMFDGTPVIHDVGRMKIRDAGDMFVPFEISYPTKSNRRILRNVLEGLFEYPNYNMDYRQYYYIARLFKDLRKKGQDGFVKEQFTPPTKDNNWVHVDEPMVTSDKIREDNIKRFNEWLDTPGEDPIDESKRYRCSVRWINHVRTTNGAKLMDLYDAGGKVVKVENIPAEGFLYLHPKTETRYHQIARVFDILSVLSALSATYVEGIQQKRIAYHYARKTAVDLCDLLIANPPGATKATVDKVVRAFLDTTGTKAECGGNNKDNEVAYAQARAAKAAVAADEAKLAELKAAADAANAEANRVRQEVKKAEEALKAAREAKAKSPDEAVADVGELDKAVLEGLSEEDKKALDVANQVLKGVVPDQKLDEAVLDASEILRDSKDEDNSAKLVEQGLLLSVENVIDESKALDGAPADLPEVKGYPILFKDGNPEDKKDAKDEAQPAAVAPAPLSSPLPNLTYEVDKNGEAKSVQKPPPDAAQPSADRSMEGGAAGTSAVALDIKIWDQCPAGLRGLEDERQTAIDAAEAVVGDPSEVVVYMGHPGAKEKQEIVKKDANYAPYALTYISAYYAESFLLKRRANGLRWDRAPGERRLKRIDVNLETLKEQSVVKSIVRDFGPEIPCLLIRKFQKTVADADVKEGVGAMLHILKGLCIERNFVIDDLHIGNMAILNGMGVTFDYDRLIEKNEGYVLFMGKLEEMRDHSERYTSLEQFENVYKLYDYLKENPGLTERYFRIYDLLSVLGSLRVLCRRLGGLSAVEACEVELKGESGSTFDRRITAVNALAVGLKGVVWPDMTIVDVFDGKPVPKSTGPMRRTPGSFIRVTASPAGGRRTFRRKGLPQLL